MEVTDNSINDIITYKEDNGIVFGYLNQKALDIAIYNRVKEECNSNQKLIEISSQTHSITFRPVPDGEYISVGDCFLVVGTILNRGIKLFSNYSGFYSNKIDDLVSRNINLGNIIKDGDLLFTIKLAPRPECVETPITPTKEVKFSYKMLPRDFVESIPYLSDITINRWFVDDYTKVEEGDELLEITEYTTLEPRYSTILKSPYSGLLIKGIRGINRFKQKLDRGQTLFTIYTDQSKLKDRYPNEIVINTDEFTKAVTVKGGKCAGNSWGFVLGTIIINFEVTGSKYFLLLEYDRKNMNLNKKCSLHLLLRDGSIITLNAIANPTKVFASNSMLRYQVPPEDITKLETKEFLKWQITNEEGIAISTGDNICCLDRNDTTGITQELSYEVFQDFIKEFHKKVIENISEEKQPSSTKEDLKVKEKDSCYVYLMIDTTNNFHKIGISNHPRYREHTLQSDKPTIELLCAKEYPSRIIAESIESALHKAYANKRIRGEWFNLDASDIENIKQTLK